MHNTLMKSDSRFLALGTRGVTRHRAIAIANDRFDLLEGSSELMIIGGVAAHP